jgi:hypothetical protein
MPTYATYVADCTARGKRPISYVAWANLQPPAEWSF